MQLSFGSRDNASRISTPCLTASIFALICCGWAAGATAGSRVSPALVADVAPAAGFGNPPSGEIPILFNDRNVYAKPDLVKRGRVLAALVKNGQMYVPLRSMFERLGATVSASPDGKTITVSNGSASVNVTLGSNEVVINGEKRPLDVPPMLYDGIVYVPVRVLSEAMGAYVLWIPERHVVVVRYVPVVASVQSPVPSPPPPPSTVSESAAPAATMTPAPAQRPYGFVEAAYSGASNYNEFAADKYCPEFIVSGAYAFKNSPIAVKVDFRQFTYITSDDVDDAFGNHYTQFATIDGGTAFTNVFRANQTSLDVRLEYQVAAPRIYVALSYLQTSNTYGYANLNAVGAGIEKLPDLRPGINPYASLFYFPSASGNYTVNDPASSNFGKTYQQQYHIVKYDVGVALVIKHSPVYLYGGFAGEQYAQKQNAPVGQTHDGPYIGLGLKI